MKRLFLQYQEDTESISTISSVLLLSHRLADVSDIKTEKIRFTRDNFYNTVFNYSLKFRVDAFKHIKNHDEIYGCDAICPCTGYARNIDSGSFFNEIMQFLIKEKITGKKFFFIRDNKSIAWTWLRPELLLNAFKNNELYVSNSSTLEWNKVDIETVVEFEIGHTIKPKIVSKSIPVKKTIKKKK